MHPKNYSEAVELALKSQEAEEAAIAKKGELAIKLKASLDKGGGYCLEPLIIGDFPAEEQEVLRALEVRTLHSWWDESQHHDCAMCSSTESKSLTLCSGQCCNFVCEWIAHFCLLSFDRTISGPRVGVSCRVRPPN